MTPPRGLVATALLFWGWQTGLLPFALLLAVPLEAPRWLAPRLEIATLPLARLFDLCLLGSILIAGLLITAGPSTEAVVRVLQVSPLTLAPFVLVQSWSVAGRVDLKALWSNRQRRQPPPAAPYLVDFRWLYLVICAVAAAAANQRTPLFFAGLVALGGWALFGVRARHAPLAAWLVLFATASAVGYGGTLALQRLQELLVELAIDYLAGSGSESDPYRTATSLGRIGELKLSDAIVLRVRHPPGEPPPRLLHRASYDTYSGGAIWYAEGAPLATVESANIRDGAWRLAAGGPADRAVTIAATLSSERAVLAAPFNAVAIDGLAVDALRRNRLGVLEAAPSVDGLVSYRVGYRTAAVDRALDPTPADLVVHDGVKPVIERVAGEIALAGLAPDAALRRLESWFAGGFGYSLYLPGSTIGRSAVEAFLTERRAGHCEYFATATVLLLRAAGIPARYATGYAVDEWSDLEQAFVVRRRHAHAWARAYLDGRWIDVDTTPATWAGIERAEAAWWQPAADLWDWLGYRYRAWRADRAESGVSPAWGLVLPPLAALFGWRYRNAVRQHGRTGPPGVATAAPARRRSPGAFDRLEARLAERGLARGATELPSRWAGRVEEALAGMVEPDWLRPVVAWHYRDCYDPRGLTANERAAQAKRVEHCLAALAKLPLDVP